MQGRSLSAGKILMFREFTNGKGERRKEEIIISCQGDLATICNVLADYGDMLSEYLEAEKDRMDFCIIKMKTENQRREKEPEPSLFCAHRQSQKDRFGWKPKNWNLPERKECMYEFKFEL